MASWFIALPVAPGEWFDRVGVPPPGVRRFHPDDLHVTVAFLGPAGEVAARAGWEALVWQLPATTVTLGPVVPMGSPRKPSAFSALLGVGREQVEAAMGEARGACFAAAGAAPEERPPKAHVTVARPSRSAVGTARREGERWAAALDLGAPAVVLDHVALYTWSEDRSAGPQFRVVAARALAPA